MELSGRARMLIAQITDIHLGSIATIGGEEVDPRKALDRAVTHLNTLDPRPDVVLVTGDMTNKATPEEYAELRAGLSPLEPPYFLIPGNHDDRPGLRAAFPDHAELCDNPDFIQYTVEDYPLRLIALDTIVPGKSGGDLCPARLAWLDQRLAEAPDRPTVIFMHHPPFAVGMPGFDAIGCDNGAALGRILDGYDHVEAVLCGHVHRAISLLWHGTVVHVTPSTTYQYPLDMTGERISGPALEPAACRLCLWYDGALVSHLSHIT